MGGGRWEGVVFCKSGRRARKEYQHLSVLSFSALAQRLLSSSQ